MPISAKYIHTHIWVKGVDIDILGALLEETGWQQTLLSRPKRSTSEQMAAARSRHRACTKSFDLLCFEAPVASADGSAQLSSLCGPQALLMPASHQA